MLLVTVLAAVSVIAVAVVPGGSSPTADAALANQIDRAWPGPIGAITVIGDSVMQGGALYSPTFPDRLAQQGWGPIRFRAGVGYSTGYFRGVPAEAKATYWLGLWRSQGWDPRDVVVNLGANDSGQCGTNLACARAAILHLVDAIGPGHRIWWPMITRIDVSPYREQAATWNAALAQIDAERTDVSTWDWPAEMAAGPYPSNDNTHLSPDGYRRRSLRMAEVLAGRWALAELVGGDVALPAAGTTPSEYVALVPARVRDTRLDGGRPVAGGTVSIPLSGKVPAGTTAVALNVTVTESDADGYLTAHPCDRPRPDASAVNHRRGEDRGAMVVVPVAADGSVCISSFAAADVVVDLQGAFVPPGPTGDRFTAVANPARLLDTRATGRADLHRVLVPGGATAVAVTITATGASAPGYLTAFPCGGEVPVVSNVNYGVGEDVAGAAFVPTASGAICVAASSSVDVIVDLTGSFAADGELGFLPVDPTRTADTRRAIGGWATVHGAGQVIDVRVAPPGAVAVTGTITLVEPVTTSYLTAWGCGPAPTTSSVNATAGAVLASAVTVGVDPGGRLCLRAERVGHTLFDTTGWWVR
jgi:GDSL-like Lipase/Acylhydrolase family